MKVKELIEKLSHLDQEVDVMILDSFNGGGAPREINHGPRLYFISKEDAEESGDCEERVGEKIIIMGFGCY